MRVSGNSSLGKINDRAFLKMPLFLAMLPPTVCLSTPQKFVFHFFPKAYTQRHYAGAGISKEGLFLSLMEKMSSNTSIS